MPLPIWSVFAPGLRVENPALLRHKSGALHVVWGGSNLRHAAFISPSPASPLLNSAVRAEASAPWITAAADGSSTQILFLSGGTLHTAVTKDAVGERWEAIPGTGAAPAVFAASGGNKEGQPYLLSADGSKLTLKAPAADAKLETVHEGAAGCRITRAALALDGESSEGWAAWHERSTKSSGLYVKAVKPVSGKATLAPGSQPLLAPPSQRLALTPRLSAPGVYLAYVTGVGELKLWNTRGGEALTIAKVSPASLVAVAAGPEGRLWLLWTNPLTRSISAVLASKSLVRFSKPYALGSPSPAPIRHLLANADKGPLDVIANESITRLLPELELKMTPEGVRVFDLGEPVEGVSVEIAGKVTRTDALGLAARPLPKGTKPAITARHPDYQPITVRN